MQLDYPKPTNNRSNHQTKTYLDMDFQSPFAIVIDENYRPPDPINGLEYSHIKRTFLCAIINASKNELRDYYFAASIDVLYFFLFLIINLRLSKINTFSGR